MQVGSGLRSTTSCRAPTTAAVANSVSRRPRGRGSRAGNRRSAPHASYLASLLASLLGLTEERGRLEERVTKLGMELLLLLLERKQLEDAERRQHQEEMERIQEDNRRKVGDAAPCSAGQRRVPQCGAVQ